MYYIILNAINCNLKLGHVNQLCSDTLAFIEH